MKTSFLTLPKIPQKKILCTFFCVYLFVGMCDNPFFPPLGPPVKQAGNSQSTPQGILNQLINAYEKRNSVLFSQLLAPNNLPDSISYRFYMSTSFANEKLQTGTILRPDIIAPGTYTTVPPGTYYYWSRDEEIYRHEKLFTGATSLQFSARPFVDGAINYTVSVSVETLGVKSDGSDFYIQKTYDTTQAELSLDGGNIAVTAPDLYSGSLDFALGKQVFILKRNPFDRNIWIISRWFDFGL